MKKSELRKIVREVIQEIKVPAKGSADWNQLKIARDTIMNPNKGIFMGGPDAKEAEETLIKKFGYTNDQVKRLKGGKESMMQYHIDHDHK